MCVWDDNFVEVSAKMEAVGADIGYVVAVGGPWDSQGTMSLGPLITVIVPGSPVLPPCAGPGLGGIR